MGIFFVSWALWEEMTFVLACAIVVVFLIGLFKLWRTSRQVRRQEVIDEEKRARLTEMRKVGMSSSPTARSAAATRKQRTNSDIPFGVRAIQTGVEVDGIWISRPTTPSRSSSKSKMGLMASAAGSSSSAAGIDTHSNMSTPLPQISEDEATFNTRILTKSPTTSTRPGPSSGALNEEALRRLEGAYSPTYRGAPISSGAVASPTTAAPQLNTYIPSSRMSSPSSSINKHHAPGTSSRLSNYQLPPPPTQQQLQRTSTASADSLTSMSGGAAGGAGLSSRSNRSTSSRSSTSSASRHPTTSAPATDKLYHAITHDTIGPLPTSPTRLAAAGYYHNHNHTSSTTSTTSTAAAAYTPTSAPFPGDALANRTSRKINPAFEVLPAGTFGTSLTPYTDEDDNEIVLDGRRRAGRDSSSSAASAFAHSGVRNKLRRAS
ncbi:hypothetical protein Sste5346_001565 [Sporothrix stenoceras]|uniref:Uncharacterized protein n=1 Tax=Sporothrix stenoceras TaxID=5173 RepID=A0ABR3ZNY2_9PEZI